jgi:hypothetical protein
MNELLKTKLFKDLAAGKLPEVQVAVTKESLYSIGLTMVIVIAIGLLGQKILQSV